MNESETKSLPTFAEESQRSGAPLQGQVTMLLLAMVVLSGILTAYLYVQQRYAIQDRDSNKQVVGQFVQVFRQQQKPIMDGVLEKLREYSKKDPNFIPVLTKYGYGSQSATTGPALATPTKAVTPKPAPAPATAPKK